MMYSSGNGDTKIVKFLIKNGADVNAKNANGYTALMRASDTSQSGKIVKMLIESEADIDACWYFINVSMLKSLYILRLAIHASMGIEHFPSYVFE